MESVKLSITCRGALEAKYDVRTRARIDTAIANWIPADAQRGIRTIHLAVDDAKAMKPYKVAPVTGEVTAEKVKVALDALVARLSPDYIVLMGSGDVVPLFDVPNPTFNEDGDTDESVPTDNPYASSRKFDLKKRATYLVPDRVVGRMPDLPGSKDATWLTRYLAVATGWKSLPASKYAKDLMVCTTTWRKSGQACAKYVARDIASLLLSPPVRERSKPIRDRHGALFQMIKCHGSPNDSAFYGQKGNSYPEALRSRSLDRRTKKATVVGAMCCFGANVFDPLDPTAVNPGEPPIPNVYLRQGAFGFLGSTCTAWVGLDAMLCADWIVAAFLKSVMSGASLGRAALEAKQDFVRWNEQQGDQIDSADEKTLLQFTLLGDPSVHPVIAAGPAAVATASLLGAKPGAAVTLARRQRRAARFELGAVLRDGLPERQTLKAAAVPKSVKGVATQLAERAGVDFKFKLASPKVQRVKTEISQPELSVTAALPLVAAKMRSSPAKLVSRTSYQYYWTARYHVADAPVAELRMVTIQADPSGHVLRTQLLASSAESSLRRRSRESRATTRTSKRNGAARGRA
jgi:hypothetical protein